MVCLCSSTSFLSTVLVRVWQIPHCVLQSLVTPPRRLVDVSQDVIRSHDCGSKKGLPMQIAERDADGNLVLVKNADGGPYSRILAADVIDPADGETVLYKRGDALFMDVLNDLVAHGVEKVSGRSVLTCESTNGVCAMCYGWSLATNRLVDIGEAVQVLWAAQSIGEPGTQLTLRSFHSGGVLHRHLIYAGSSSCCWSFSKHVIPRVKLQLIAMQVLCALKITKQDVRFCSAQMMVGDVD